MTSRPYLLLSLVLLSACGSTGTETTTTQLTDQTTEQTELVSPLIELAETDDAEAYEYTNNNGASIESTSDGETFTVWWQPEDFNPETDITFVSLHGHAAWATDDFKAWHSELQERNYAYLGLQWWYGKSLEAEGYLDHVKIYPYLVEALQNHGIEPGKIIFQGFSMGSAVTYIVTAQDRQAEQPYFSVTIANSGVLELSDSYNASINRGDYGAEPYTGSHWILYCGIKDEEHENWCQQMEATDEWIKRMGGTVDLFIKDPIGSHSGMMAPKMKDQVLDLAETLLSR